MNKFKKFLERTFQFFAVAGLISFSFITPTFAAAAEDLNILISDSRPSTVANYTITYDQGSGGTFSSGDTLVVTFPSGFDLTALTEPTDFDFKVAAADETVVVTGCGATDEVSVLIASQVITFTACGSYTAEAADSIIEIEIGLHADSGADQIINHATPAVYNISVNATDEDSKDALIAIVAGVAISATVDESLSLTVTGITAASTDCVDLGGAPTDVDTTPTAVTFGTVTTEAFYTGCQKIAADTNAQGGYNVSVTQTQLLTSGGDTIAEGVCDATCADATLGGWETATNNGFAYCADDIAGNAAADASIAAADQCDDATPLYYTFFTLGTAPTVYFMSSTAPVSGDETNISYHLSVAGDQAAGTYTNTTFYVMTATF